MHLHYRRKSGLKLLTGDNDLRFFGSEPEVEIPKYEKPSAASFNNFGLTGSYNKDTNTYSASADPNDLATMTAVKSIRNDLLKSLGLGGTPESDPYTQQYMNELLRYSQPKLENALIGRGLGGSTVYKDALTDLISKAGVASVLGGQQYKAGNLGMLENFINSQMGYGQNLLQLTQSNDMAQQALAQQLYNATLPYLASVKSNDYSGLGSLLGAGLMGGLSLAIPGSGIGLAGLTGAQMTGLGALGGGILGGAF